MEGLKADGGTATGKAPMLAEIEGYVTESAYPSSYHDTFAPAWTDDCLLRAGIRPPRYGADMQPGPFTMLDLGCGDGLGLILLAATHPESRFIGIDVRAGHVESARIHAARLGIDNARFMTADFAAALERDDLAADYIMAQGVLSWVAAPVREQLFALVARNLLPGGAASIGYNAQPGWLGMLSFQRLVRRLALDAEGPAPARFEAALERLRALADLGLGTVGPEQLALIDEHRARLPASYFVHEYLHEGWEPQWSSNVLAMAARHGLALAGSARPDRIREDFILRKAQRDALASVADPVLHELLVDHFTACSFRCDIYVKGAPDRLGSGEAPAARLAKPWLRRPGSDRLPFERHTPAGTICFDTPVARVLWEGLAEGAATPGAIIARHGGIEGEEVLDVLDALALGHLVPTGREHGDPALERLDAALEPSGATRLINARMSPWGPVRTE